MAEFAEHIDHLDQARWTALKKLSRAVRAVEALGDDGPIEPLINHVTECEWEYVLAYREYQQAMARLAG